MTFKPCILIPIYNHKDSISRSIEKLAVYQLPIFIIDDGSNAATQKVLAELAATHSLVRLFRLPINGGKGAAVMKGMLEAYQSGFSHALQIDADGQHDIDDVPRFLDIGAAHPGDIVCGKPVYDESVPKGRLYGRYITHFWVWVETLSFAIGDSMCGFRLYPLATTCALIERQHIPTRMDFDIAIAVHLAWRNVQFQNIATKVVYPPDGLSHFRMWQDNLRITKMHTKLFFGMLVRSPRLVWRKLAGTRTTPIHWSQLAERGSATGLRILVACYRLLGKRTAGVLLYPVVGYFFVTGGKARAASMDYLRRIHAITQDHRLAPTWRNSFLHMLAFAQSALDKLSAWVGEIDSSAVDFPNIQELDELIASGRGALLIGSHLGNIEIARALAPDRRAKINAVVYTEHAQRFNQILAQANIDFGINLLQVSHFGADTAITLKDKIDQGELLVIVGDRTPPAENGRISEVPFLGQTASFAQGPFILASLLQCPVYLFFCLKEGERYRIYLEHFASRIELPKRERQARLQAYLQEYARRLEAFCLKTPMQWFNFYDFWRKENTLNSISQGNK